MRKLAAIVLGIVVALVLGAWIVIASIDWNQYRGQIEEAARELTGREARIEGDLRPSFSLEPAIVVNGVTIANASWASSTYGRDRAPPRSPATGTSFRLRTRSLVEGSEARTQAGVPLQTLIPTPSSRIGRQVNPTVDDFVR